MKRNRHLLPALLTLLIVLCALPAAQAEYSVPFPVNLRLNYDTTYDILWHDGYVLIKNHSAFYRWKPGMAQPEMMFPVTNVSMPPEGRVPFFEYLLADGGQLYAYEMSEHKIARMAPEMGAAHMEAWVQLDRVTTASRWPCSVFLRGGQLHSVYANRLNPPYGGQVVVNDIATGKAEAVPLPGLIDLVPRGRGGLLAVFAEGRSDGRATLYAMDSLAGARQPLFDLPYAADRHIRLLEDAGRGRVFLLSAGATVMLDGEGQVLWQVQNDFQHTDLPAYTFMLLTPQGELLTRDWAAMTVYTPGESSRKETLYVYGVSPDDPRHVRASGMVPGVRVEVSSIEYGEHALAPALVSGAQQVDVFLLAADQFNLPRMAAKGWFLPMTEPETAERAQGLYPLLVQAATHEGRLFGLPVSATLRTWYADAAALAVLDEPLPATFEELCALVSRWQESDEAALHFPAPALEMSYHGDLLQKAHQLYLDSLSARGAAVTFDTPLFRRLIMAADAVPKAPLRRAQEMNGRALGVPQLLAYAENEPILARRTRDAYDGYGFAPLSLSLPDGAPVRPVVSARIGCVHAESRLPEAAAAYIRAYFDCAGPEERLMMTRDGAQPVVSEAFLAEHEDNTLMLDKLQAYQQRGETPSGMTSEERDVRIANITRWLAERSGEYLISPQALAEYRQLMDTAQLCDYPRQSVQRSQNIQTLFRRFLDRQISLEQYIAGADNVLRLMQMEDR